MLPFDDETMTYDKASHKYILTKEYVLQETTIDLSKVLNPAFSSEPQRLVNVYLKRVSNLIYNWIYKHNYNNDIQEYFLATNQELRDNLRSAMLEQILYMLHNGDMSIYGGVNLKTGQVIDKNKIVENAISPLAEDILNRRIDTLGFAITYSGTYQRPLNLKYREGY